MKTNDLDRRYEAGLRALEQRIRVKMLAYLQGRAAETAAEVAGDDSVA